MSDERVLSPRRKRAASDAFDITTGAGRLCLSLVAMIVAGAAYALRQRASGAAVAVPLSALVLLPLYVTGTRAQLPKLPRELASLWLRPIRDALGRTIDLGHVELGCLARLCDGEGEFDEVRLAAVPHMALPGLTVVELALAVSGFDVVLPEVLIRVREGSAAHAKIASLVPTPPVVGRTAAERVFRVRPRVPSRTGAAKLFGDLLLQLEERRSNVKTGRFPGPERRGHAPFGRAA